MTVPFSLEAYTYAPKGGLKPGEVFAQSGRRTRPTAWLKLGIREPHDPFKRNKKF